MTGTGTGGKKGIPGGIGGNPGIPGGIGGNPGIPGGIMGNPGGNGGRWPGIIPGMTGGIPGNIGINGIGAPSKTSIFRIACPFSSRILRCLRQYMRQVCSVKP